MGYKLETMEKQLIKKQNNIALIKEDKTDIFGGNYTVLNTKTMQAKTSLCLDAAVDIFNSLIKKQ